MNKIIKSVGKDLFINRQHYDNPFAQKDPSFHVRLVAIKDSWVAYLTSPRLSVRYMKFEDFFEIFERPSHIHGETLIQFTTHTVADLKSMKGLVIKNPWHFGVVNEDYIAQEYISPRIVESLTV